MVFPRTLKQAEFLKQTDISIDYILEFSVPDGLIFERITGRRIHVPSGRTYHVKFNPPKIKGKDDKTGEALTIRKDDQKEILDKRLIEYKKIVSSLRSYYIREAKHKYIKYIKVDGTKPINVLHEELLKILN